MEILLYLRWLEMRAEANEEVTASRLTLRVARDIFTLFQHGFQYRWYHLVCFSPPSIPSRVFLRVDVAIDFIFNFVVLTANGSFLFSFNIFRQ